MVIKKSVGILNKGKDNSFIKNKFYNIDIGIQDEGENTLAEENEFINNKSSSKNEDLKKEEVLKLAPEIYGMGIDFRS